MRHLRPVDVVVDLDVPESGFIADEMMDGPSWSTLGVSRTFFGRRSRQWLLDHFWSGHVVLDGVELDVPRRASTDYRYWRLFDVERVAHALAQNGYIEIEQLVRVIRQVRLIAESWGYVEPAPIPTRIETFDPHRQGVYAVARRGETTDDLDQSPGAVERVFCLGDVEYRIDLTEEHWHDLIATLSPYLVVARRDSGRSDDPARRADRAEIRRWALRNGHSVGGRGPLPMNVVRAYLSRGDST